MPALRNVPRLDRHVYNLSHGWDGQGNLRQQATLQLDPIDGGVRSTRITVRTEDGHLNTTNRGETQYDKTNEQALPVTSGTTTSDDALLYDVSLFTSASSGARSSRNHSRRKDPYHIPRPRNAFIFFRSAYAESQRGLGPSGQQNELSKDAARVWAGMSDAQKQEYRDRALAEKLLHKKLFPHYVYSPGGKNGSAKAKVSASPGTAAGKRTATRKRTPPPLSAAAQEAPYPPGSSSSPEAGPFDETSLVNITGITKILGSTAQRDTRTIYQPHASSAPGSEIGNTPSPSDCATTRDKEEDFVANPRIPILDLSSTPRALSIGDTETFQTLDPSLFIAPASVHAFPLDDLGFGPGYGFRSSSDPMILDESLPCLPNVMDDFVDVDVGMYGANNDEFGSAVAPITQASIAPFLPHSNEFATPFDDFDFLTDYSTYFPATSSSELDAEFDPINQSLAAIDLNYDYSLDCGLTGVDLEKIEVEVYDYASGFSRSANDEGKEGLE